MRIVEGPAGERLQDAVPAFQLDVMRSLRLHLKLAGFVACVVLVLTVGYALTRKPMYEARSLSYVEPLETKVVSDGAQGIYDPARYDSYFQQQIQTATRQDILEAAITKMPAGTWQKPSEDIRAAAERLANSLKVERVGSSYQLAISVMSENPGKSAAIVNAATNSYLEQGRKDENARSDGRLILLQEEGQRIQKELQQDRDEQSALSKTLGVADTQSGGANPYDMQLAGVRSELVAAREAHDVAAAQLASVTGRNGSSAGLKAIADEAVAGDSGFSALKTTINERRAVLNTQMATLTPGNPVYKQDADEIASIDRQVEARSTQLRQTAEHRVEDKLRLELQRTGDVESRLNGELAHATSQAGSAAPRLQRAKDLAADITRLQARYATVDDALRGLQLESSGPGTAHLLIAAQVPDAPAANRKLLLLAISLPLAAFAGIAAAVIARKRDRRLYSAADLELAVGLPPMCTLPPSYDDAQDEHLLRMAAGLERGYRLNGACMFVFTAASEPMNASGVIYGVQSKLIELGFKVVVLAAEDVLQSTAAERKLGQGSSQLEELKRENTFLLIDARPLLHSADTEYAVGCADATLVIAECGLTTGVELRQCMLLLQQLKATGVGTILLNASDAGGEAPVSRTLEEEEPRQRVPVWERTRSEMPSKLSFVPKWSDEEDINFGAPSEKVAEDLPKRVQLVAMAAAEKQAPIAYREEPFMFFQEASFTMPEPSEPEEVATIRPVDVAQVVEPIIVAVNEVNQPFYLQTPRATVQVAQPIFEPVGATVEGIEPPFYIKTPKFMQQPVTEGSVDSVLGESPEDGVERLKREAVARVRARFAMRDDAVNELTAAMTMAIPQPTFASPTSSENPAALESVVEEQAVDQIAEVRAVDPVAVARVVNAPAGDKIYNWQGTPVEPQQIVVETVLQPIMEAIVLHPDAVVADLKPQPTVASVELPPVRRVTVSQERSQLTSRVADSWAPPMERRRESREPIAFPRGLNKAALRMQEKGQTMAKGQLGPSLTAAEQAIANKISGINQSVAGKVTVPRHEVRTQQVEEPSARWSLLRQFGGFDLEERSLQERAAG